MKLLCVGYYDKFSRFFIGIHKEIKEQLPFSEIKLVSLYTSGFLYSALRMYSSVNIPFKAWFKVLIHYKSYNLKLRQSNTDLDDLISYKLREYKKLKAKPIKLLALAYIDIYTKIFNQFRPDVLCCVGDSRLAVKIAIAIAKEKKIPCYFIEIGPFQTTIFDSVGVNANASINTEKLISQLPESKFQNLSEIFQNRPETKKAYNRSPIYRGIDYSLGALLNRTKLYPPDLAYQHPTFNGQRNSIHAPLKQNKYLLIGQVPDDVNMSYHSPHFDNFETLLKTVYQQLPENSSLSFREHPHFTGKHKKEFYTFITKNKINLDNHTPLDELVTSHDIIVVNNSTVGLESMAKLKTVVVLGNAYYALPELCLQIKNICQIKTVLNQALSFRPKAKIATQYFDYLLNTYFIAGRLIDKDQKSAKKIAHLLMEKHA
ncbi:MAG: capsular polysaccharide export protein, LipB/KpsS family [Flavobacteriaceae bacterium]